MRRVVLALLLSSGFYLSPCVNAQDKGKPAEAEKKPAEAEKKSEYWKDSAVLRLQVVFTEKDGEKKISSLPYTLVLHSNAPGRAAALRMGLKVPVSTGPSQTQYMDVGTNLDGHAEKTEDGRFQLNFSVERSSLYYPPSDQKAASANGGESGGERPSRPIIQNFRAEINVLIRDGQTIESMVATDPVTGHVLKVDVTLNVIK